MSVLSDKLTTIAVQNVKPRAKPFKLADGKGLYLLVMPDGAKYWRLRYRFEGTNRQSGVFKLLDKTLALGVFPAVSLSDARKAVTTAKKQLADGVDPGAALKQQNAARHAKRREGADTFEAVTRDWMARQAGRIARVTASKDLWLFTTYLFPKLGQRPIRELSRSPGELRDALQAIEKTGKLETAARAKMKAGQVFRYAILEGRGDADPTTALRGLLQSPMVKHHSTITDPKQIGELLLRASLSSYFLPIFYRPIL